MMDDISVSVCPLDSILLINTDIFPGRWKGLRALKRNGLDVSTSMREAVMCNDWREEGLKWETVGAGKWLEMELIQAVFLLNATNKNGTRWNSGKSVFSGISSLYFGLMTGFVLGWFTSRQILKLSRRLNFWWLGLASVSTQPSTHVLVSTWKATRWVMTAVCESQWGG